MDEEVDEEDGEAAVVEEGMHVTVLPQEVVSRQAQPTCPLPSAKRWSRVSNSSYFLNRSIGLNTAANGSHLLTTTQFDAITPPPP